MQPAARALLFLSAALVLPTAVLCYCLEGRLQGSRRIPVYLEAPDETFLGIETGVVRHQLQVALDNWYEKGASDVRPYFAGIRRNLATPGDGEVYIKQTTDCDRCSNNACEKTKYSFSTPLELGQRLSSIIWLERGCNACYTVYPGSEACDEPGVQELNLQGVLTHEFGHALGLEDEYNLKCEDIEWSSAMAGNCNHGRTITRRDIGGLQALYGHRAASYDYRESRDGGLSWRPGTPENTVHVGPGIFRIGSMGASEDRESFAAVYANLAPRYTAAVRMKPAVSYDWRIPRSGEAARSWDAAAAADKSASSRAIAFTQLESEVDCRHSIMILLTEDGWASHAQEFIVDGDGFLLQTPAEGVSMTYDPERDVYVVAFADTNNRVRVETIMASAPHNPGRPAFVRSEKTIDTPAVACGAASTTGPANCMMMWLGVDGYNQPRWTVGAVDDDLIFKEGDINTHPYVGWQTPTLAVQPLSGFPWIMGLKQSTVMYTWRHRPDPTGPWVSERPAVWTRRNGLLSGSLTLVRAPQVVGPVADSGMVRSSAASSLFLNAELHMWFTRTAY